MKKTVKKLTAVGLTLTTVMGLVACGGKKDDENKDNGVVTKPQVIKVMVDNTVLAETNGGEKFYEYLEGLLEKVGDEGKIDLQFTRPPHGNDYYNAVATSFNNKNNQPDVVLLSSDYYALYAANEMLWNMTDAWNNSETKKSGRLIDGADKIFEALMVNDIDGNKAMYGFSPYRGNGCCTYVKLDWLEKAGYKRADVEGKTMTFDEFYTMLKKMKDTTSSDYVVSPPGFVSDEAPYTNYMPEFFQKANFTFYKDASGKYVDGFSEQAMIDALDRIAQGVKDGVINAGADGNSTSDARNRFYSTDPKTESGIFTYWAGNWANTLKVNLTGKTRTDGTAMSDELIAINPIKELGAYVERLAPAWCITAECQNPEGVFKYFIDTMLDGGDIQMAWQYGAKGTHWDTKAESFTLKGKEGKEGASYSYTEGTFHFLPSPEDPSKLISKNHIDPPLALAEIPNDPGKASLTQVAKDNAEFFVKNCVMAVPLPMTEALSLNDADIKAKRKEIVSKVAMGECTGAEGIAEYKAAVGTKIDEVLKSLNEKSK